MKLKTLVSAAAALALMATMSATRAAVITTALGMGADGGTSESESTSDGSLDDATGGGNGTGNDMNARFSDTNRNDMIVMRFDLTSVVNKSQIQNASINMIATRSNEVHPLRYFGVTPGTSNGANTAENWDENSLNMATFPAMTVDGDSSTRGVVLGSVSDLGQGAGTNSDVEGGLVTFSSAALDTFLQGLGATNLVSFIVQMDDIDGGQMRYQTKEATLLASGDPNMPMPAGTYAPYLEFSVVPEPASAVLLGFMGLILATKLRRRV